MLLTSTKGGPESIAEFIKAIIEVPRSSATRIQVLFSSRPLNTFIDHFQGYPGFRIHEHTTEDIRRYVTENMMPSLNRYLSSAVDSEQLEVMNLFSSIVKKAEGVFLWVKLIVTDLIRSSRDGATPAELISILSRLPRDLIHFYERIVEKIPSEYRMESYIMLEIALRARGPMIVSNFLTAVECAKERSLLDSIEHQRESTATSDEIIARRLKSRVGDLLQIVHNRDERSYIQFMHQTVKEFVARPGFQKFILGSSLPENGFSFLSKYMLSMLGSRSQNKGQEPKYMSDMS